MTWNSDGFDLGGATHSRWRLRLQQRQPLMKKVSEQSIALDSDSAGNAEENHHDNHSQRCRAWPAGSSYQV